MTVARLIKHLLKARNQNAAVKFIDADGKTIYVKNIYIGDEFVVLEGENI